MAAPWHAKHQSIFSWGGNAKALKSGAVNPAPNPCRPEINGGSVNQNNPVALQPGHDLGALGVILILLNEPPLKQILEGGQGIRWRGG